MFTVQNVSTYILGDRSRNFMKDVQELHKYIFFFYSVKKGLKVYLDILIIFLRRSCLNIIFESQMWLHTGIRKEGIPFISFHFEWILI